MRRAEQMPRSRSVLVIVDDRDPRRRCSREEEPRSFAWYDRSMLRRILPLLVLVVLGTSIIGLALDPAFEPPSQHYDGDADDAGHVGKLRAHGFEAAVTDARLELVPSPTTLFRAPSEHPEPPLLSRDPLGSRAPPG